MIHDYALLFFGVPYLEADEAKPFDQRHPALQWMQIRCNSRDDPAAIDELMRVYASVSTSRECVREPCLAR
jgi:hypothetical protein